MISVIIPTCHRNDLLALCLERLAPGVQTLAAEAYEVIVTDDGYTSNAEAMISAYFPWARWVQGPRRGPAANRNNGAQQAKGDWLVFTDDDCLPDPHWLKAYRSAIVKMPDIKVFEGRTYADRERRRMDEESPINETGGYLWSCNFAIHKIFFFELGCFDEQFPYAAMEDVDLHYRIRKAAQPVVYLKDASICHPWRTHGGADKFRKLEVSMAIYLDKHPAERNRLNSRYYLVAIKNHMLQILRKESWMDSTSLFFFFKKGYHLFKMFIKSLSLLKTTRHAVSYS